MSRRTETAYKAKSPGKLAPHNEAQWFRRYGKCCGCVAKVHTLIPLKGVLESGEICLKWQFNVVLTIYPVKLPAGATGQPSPGGIRRASRLILRYKTKRS